MSELKNTNGNSFSKFNKMSTEELDEILRLDFQLPDGEGLDEDTILYITEVIASREKSLPKSACPDVDAAWEDLISNYLPDGTNDLLGSGVESKPVQSPKQPSPAIRRHSRSIRWVLRIASVAAILAVLFFATTITAYALGYDVWGAIAKWSNETFSFSTNSNTSEDDPDQPLSETESAEFSSLQEVLDYYDIHEPIAPTWIPARFTFNRIYVNEAAGYIDFSAFYTDEDNTLILSAFWHKGIPSNSIEWQKDADAPKVYEAGGITHYLMTNLGKSSAVWLSGTCECSISGDVSETELTIMIDSIYEGGSCLNEASHY